MFTAIKLKRPSRNGSQLCHEPSVYCCLCLDQMLLGKQPRWGVCSLPPPAVLFLEVAQALPECSYDGSFHLSCHQPLFRHVYE